MLNNSGDHWRDFTYINDVVEILYKLKNKKFKNNQIYNICSNKPIHVKKLISYLIKKTEYKKIKNVKHNNYEVFKTHGHNKKILKIIDFKKFSDFYSNVDATIDWYKDYNHLNLGFMKKDMFLDEKVTVVIVTFKSEHIIEKCLDNIDIKL